MPVPTPGPREVPIRVAAADVIGTDVSTRIGGYAWAVIQGTGRGATEGFGVADGAGAA